MFYVVSQSRDSELVGRIAADLRESGHEVLIPIKPNPDALRHSRAALVVLSPADESAPRFISEILAALDLNVPIVPVLAAACDLPERLRGHLAADFTGGYQIGLTELLLKVEEGAPEKHAIVRTDGQSLEVAHPTRRAALMHRLLGAAPMAAAGGGLGALAQLLIYLGDSRMATAAAPALLITVLGGAVVAGFFWALAGFIAGDSRRAKWLAGALSLGVVTAWVALFGTYADVLSAAAILGAPIAGVIGAALGQVKLGEAPRVASLEVASLEVASLDGSPNEAPREIEPPEDEPHTVRERAAWPEVVPHRVRFAFS